MAVSETGRPVMDLSAVVGDYPQTKAVKAHRFEGDRIRLHFEEFDPVHDAFDAMVQRQPWDLCEMAIVAFFQARMAKKPISLLPMVMVGHFHHGSIWCSPEKARLEPRDLRGKRVGVRSYSQTTGMWVRGILSEEYGVAPEEVTWVTTEGSHSDAYDDPPYVERIADDANLAQLVRSGELEAAILGPRGAPGLAPLVDDPAAAARSWYDRRHVVPINHMICVKTELAERHPDAVRDVYRVFREGYEAAGIPPPGRQDGGLPGPVRYGRANVRDALETGVRMALEQRLIAEPLDVDQLLVPGGDD